MSGFDLFDLLSILIASLALIVSAIINCKSLRIAQRTLETRFDAKLFIEYDRDNLLFKITNNGYGVAHNIIIELFTLKGEVFQTLKIKSLPANNEPQNASYSRSNYLLENIYTKKKKYRIGKDEDFVKLTPEIFLNLNFKGRDVFVLATIYYEDIHDKMKKNRFKVNEFRNEQETQFMTFQKISEKLYQKIISYNFEREFKEYKIKIKTEISEDENESS